MRTQPYHLFGITGEVPTPYGVKYVFRSLYRQKQKGRAFALPFDYKNRSLTTELSVPREDWATLRGFPDTEQGSRRISLRKEVIQPQVLLQLPCYDFTPIMSHTLGATLLTVRITTSSTTHFRDVTGGVYKARERIHRIVLIRDY